MLKVEIDLRSFNVTILNVVCTPILHKYGKEKLWKKWNIIHKTCDA